MEKEFVPYEESLELKQLGFNEPCFGEYRQWNGNEPWLQLYQDLDGCSTDPADYEYTVEAKAPTFSQAFRWFREKYNIDAWVQPFTTEKSNGKLFLPDVSYSYFIFKDGDFVCDKVDLFDTEEAELACLRKLIEIVKQKQKNENS